MFELFVNSDLVRTRVERQFGAQNRPDRPRRSRAVAATARRFLAAVRVRHAAPQERRGSVGDLT